MLFKEHAKVLELVNDIFVTSRTGGPGRYVAKWRQMHDPSLPTRHHFFPGHKKSAKK